MSESAKKLPVITISREYGAYGTDIARALSKRFGIEFYNKDFVKKTAKESGYSEEEIAEEGEAMSRAGKFMNSLLNNAAVYTSAYDRIFEAQREVILELAKEGPCIIVGRCADYVLREAGIKSFNIYLHASIEDRIERATTLGENGNMDISKYIHKRDVLRKTYYKKYTGTEMGESDNYTVSLDVGAFGVDTVVDLLVEMIEKAV